ncbi:serine/threonine-protein kinase PLK4 isoform X2 [Exaiptasia diaphana]|uniref:POLO box domain-containing protein n=1 Tax=Exaiptasia diaphana TaxID=2652724 RepID=A0A913YM03_EXADI|nr:serine/threonine-protein kinase PLK4 isoform X2 [Exaiptasia diaphana]
MIQSKEREEQSMLDCKKKSTVSPTAEIFKSAYVDGIGWASQLMSGGIWVQYSDGSQLIINASDAVKYTDCNGLVTQLTDSTECQT